VVTLYEQLQLDRQALAEFSEILVTIRFNPQLDMRTFSTDLKTKTVVVEHGGLQVKIAEFVAAVDSSTALGKFLNTWVGKDEFSRLDAADKLITEICGGDEIFEGRR